MKKVRIYYSPKYVGSGHAFDTTRKAKWIADSLAESPIPGIGLVEPDPLTRDQVAQVHDLGYILAIRTGLPRRLKTAPPVGSMGSCARCYPTGSEWYSNGAGIGGCRSHSYWPVGMLDPIWTRMSWSASIA
jgi:hypothetical protein